ncbi:MAG: hypothetical protein ACREXR_18165 [Gammaproteobacteria bacterium]
MSALLLQKIRAAGFDLRVEDGDLVVTPGGRLTGEQRNIIKKRKAALIEILLAGISWQTEAEELRRRYSEGVSILEKMQIPAPELASAQMLCQYAMNAKHRWCALHAALEGVPELQAKIPSSDGVVDSLPLGVAKLALLRGKVIRQGAYSESRREIP